MKSLLFLLVVLLCSSGLFAQTILFSDDFEAGTTNWTLQGSWGLSSTASYSTSHSLTESPVGDYAPSLNYITATMTTGVNLSSSLSADLSFYGKYVIEGGFDYMYLDVSANGGAAWTNIDVFDDTLANWTKFNYSLGGFVGNPNVKVRFRFYSDVAVQYDGMNIDDFIITSDTFDNAPPLVVHTPPTFYQGVLGAKQVSANIIDISGVATAELNYRVDSGSYITITPTSSFGNTYQYVIPQINAGSLVEYYFYAIDSSPMANTVSTPIYKYLAGNYIFYDNGVVDVVDSITSLTGAAVRISLPAGNQHLTSILLRNYTDVNRPNDSMLVHIWTNASGLPGTDIIPPFKVFPTADLQNTSPMTLIDLRGDSALLDTLVGDIFIGYTVPTGSCWAVLTQPGAGARSYKYGTSGWVTQGTSDFHFRAVTKPSYVAPPPAPTAAFTFDTALTPTIGFINQSTGLSVTYLWNFGDGITSNSINTSHTYAANNNYLVCLKVTNGGGVDSVCHNVPVNSINPPISNFTFNITGDPIVIFTDQSTNGPTQWSWDFDDFGLSSNLQNPAHTFPAVGGTYHVCLVTTNMYGSSAPACQDVVLSVGAGIDPAFNAENINIYPNPMTDKSLIDINLASNSDISVYLYDVQGKGIKLEYIIHNDNIEIIRNNLEAGQYFIEILDGKNVKYKSKLFIR